jgi:predicted transport protein
MALFQKENNKVSLVKPTKFKNEKELQSFIEFNLETIFNCKFVATEFPTGPIHSGRIDTLAISEENNPVIIEYKIVESSELINQSLFYLSWIKDHRGDFQVAVDKSIGKNNIKIDWTDIRVICIAPGYKKYDLHAVQMMGANIELWEYKLYENGSFHLNEIFRKAANSDSISTNLNGKNPVMVAAGKKAALTRASGSYTFKEHLEKVDGKLKELAQSIQSFILEIDDTIEENPKKFYVAYKITQNFVCMEVQKNKIVLFLKLNPEEIKEMPQNGRTVRDIGHYGTGDFELSIRNIEDFEKSKEFIMLAYNNIGG